MRLVFFCRLTIPVVIAIMAAPAFAEVDPADGSFRDTTFDFNALGPPWDSLLVRTYSSRLKSEGVFGVGWCHLLDEKVETTSRGLQWRFCARGRPIEFELRSDGHYSSSYGLLQTLRTSPKKLFRLELPAGQTRLFDERGHLIQVSFSDGQKLAVLRNTSGSPTALVIGKQHFEIGTRSGRITKILQNKKNLITYHYRGKLLTQVRTEAVIVDYKYQTSGLIESIWFQSQPYRRLKYDSQNRVVQIDHDGCTEKLSYETETRGFTMKTSQKAICAGKVVQERQFKSSFETKKRLLIAQEISGPGYISTVHLKKENGLPLKKIVNKNESVFIYNDSGLLKTRKTGAVSENFDYDTNLRLSRYEKTSGPHIEVSYAFTYENSGQFQSVYKNGKLLSLKTFRTPAVLKGSRQPASIGEHLMSLKTFQLASDDRQQIMDLLSAYDIVRELSAFHQGQF